jgi:hypothetical protein
MSPWLQSVTSGLSAPVEHSRIARCECGAERPSVEREELFGFQDRGPGSFEARNRCTCGYLREAHFPDSSRVRPLTVVERFLCKQFEPKGPRQYDSFYCGCRGME